MGVEKAVKLEPVGSLGRKMDWTAPPVLLWHHVMKAKPDATAPVAAAGNPLALTRPHGKGKVGFVTAAPLGDAPPGETAFWDWQSSRWRDPEPIPESDVHFAVRRRNAVTLFSFICGTINSFLAGT